MLTMRGSVARGDARERGGEKREAEVRERERAGEVNGHFEVALRPTGRLGLSPLPLVF